jgi:Flp pilus assembly protein TadD
MLKYTTLILLFLFPLNNYSQTQTFDEYYENGLLMIKENNIREAILKLDTAIMISPDSSKAYVARAFANKQFYNFKSANSDFYEALRLDPHNYCIYNSLEIESLNIRLEKFANQSRTANILMIV